MLFDAPISVDGPTALDDEAVSGGESEPVTLKSRKCYSIFVTKIYIKNKISKW